jgi:hypothetical protein
VIGLVRGRVVRDQHVSRIIASEQEDADQRFAVAAGLPTLTSPACLKAAAAPIVESVRQP